MAVKSPQVSVGTSATRVDTQADKDMIEGQYWSCYNKGPNRIWLGDSTVVVGVGIPVEMGATAEQFLPPGSKLYAIAEISASTVNTLQVGV
jgi:hypothetical protein